MKIKKIPQAIERRLLGTVTAVRTDAPFIALTFDDGPHPVYTPRLLKILKAHDARATFFVIGELAAAYPHIVRQIKDEGHVIGNHSWNHMSFPTLTSRERRHQIRLCQKATEGMGSGLFRPPFGHQNRASRLEALLMGFDVVTWSVLADDWMDLPAGTVADYLEERVDRGAIVLLHDGLYHALEKRFADRSATLKAVELYLGRQTSLRCVTLPELLRSGRAVKKLWKMSGDPSWMKDMQKVAN